MILWQQEAIAEFDFRPEYFIAFDNKTNRGRGKIGPETFRIVSRRAVNRVKSIGQYIPYRKAVYSNCGLRTAVVPYMATETKKKKQYAGERVSLALDSFIYFTKYVGDDIIDSLRFVFVIDDRNGNIYR